MGLLHRSKHRLFLALPLVVLLCALPSAKATADVFEQEQQYDAPPITRRIVLRYREGTRQACLEELADISSHTSMHYDFPTLNAIVLTIADDDIEKLRSNAAHALIGIEDDVPRFIDAPVDYSTKQQEQKQLLRRVKTKSKLPYGIEMVQAPQAWERGATGRHIKVCVIDTGVDGTHPDLLPGQRLNGYTSPNRPWNLDVMGHGTHVAGTVSGDHLGVAPEAQVLSVNVFDEFGSTHASDIVAAAMVCADEMHADIISLSLGGRLPSPLEEQILKRLYEDHDIITVAAAGNAGNGEFTYPASYDYAGMVSVAAVDQNKQVASFSQANSQVDIAAPGVDIMSSLPMEDPCIICKAMDTYEYGSLSGTSMAVPHISGVLALFKSFQPRATAAELLHALYASTQDKGPPGRDDHYGHGLVQALAGIEHLDDNENGFLDHQLFKPKAAVAPLAKQLSGRCPIPEQVPIDLVIKTDWNPEQTSFDLVRLSNQETLWQYSNLLPHRRFHFEVCVDSRECHVLSIHDSAGNGLCCSYGLGGYQVFYNDREVTKGAVFKDLVSVYLGECSAQGL